MKGITLDGRIVGVKLQDQQADQQGEQQVIYVFHPEDIVDVGEGVKLLSEILKKKDSKTGFPLLQLIAPFHAFSEAFSAGCYLMGQRECVRVWIEAQSLEDDDLLSSSFTVISLCVGKMTEVCKKERNG